METFSFLLLFSLSILFGYCFWRRPMLLLFFISSRWRVDLNDPLSVTLIISGGLPSGVWDLTRFFWSACISKFVESQWIARLSPPFFARSLWMLIPWRLYQLRISWKVGDWDVAQPLLQHPTSMRLVWFWAFWSGLVYGPRAYLGLFKGLYVRQSSSRPLDCGWPSWTTIKSQPLHENCPVDITRGASATISERFWGVQSGFNSRHCNYEQKKTWLDKVGSSEKKEEEEDKVGT